MTKMRKSVFNSIPNSVPTRSLVYLQNNKAYLLFLHVWEREHVQWKGISYDNQRGVILQILFSSEPQKIKL